MAAPEPEVEIAADLKELGCPYGQDDTRCKVWLAGFKAGIAKGGEVAAKAVKDTMNEHRSGQH